MSVKDHVISAVAGAVAGGVVAATAGGVVAATVFGGVVVSGAAGGVVAARVLGKNLKILPFLCGTGGGFFVLGGMLVRAFFG